MSLWKYLVSLNPRLNFWVTSGEWNRVNTGKRLKNYLLLPLLLRLESDFSIIKSFHPSHVK